MSSESEAPVRQLSGPSRFATWSLAVALSVYAMIWVVKSVEPQVYRVSFLLIALVLTFLLYPARQRQQGIQWLDLLMIALTLVAFAWPLIDLREFVYRAAEP